MYLLRPAASSAAAGCGGVGVAPAADTADVDAVGGGDFDPCVPDSSPASAIPSAEGGRRRKMKTSQTRSLPATGWAPNVDRYLDTVKKDKWVLGQGNNSLKLDWSKSQTLLPKP